MHEPHPRFPAGRLADAAYRRALLERVEALLSVLEVAQRRLVACLDQPGTDPCRQRRTLRSLEGTISVCRRARGALQREERWARDGSAPGAAGAPAGPEALAASSFAEYLRFRELGPLTQEELREVDLDAICDRLAREDPGE